MGFAFILGGSLCPATHCRVTPPTPAIVTQNAVSPLPRWALLLLCIAYVVPGFVGRDPWKNADVTAFGYMLELAHGRTPWLSPLLGRHAPRNRRAAALLAGRLGRADGTGLAVAGDGGPPTVRIALLVITLMATWYGVYYLARSPGAQPVAFAFGGEASPLDYARAIADGALLALIACLGLAQLSHEVTSYLAQLGCTALLFFAVAAMPHRTVAAAVALVLGMAGLTLSGAPALTALLGMGGALLALYCARCQHRPPLALGRRAGRSHTGGAAAPGGLDLWRWRVVGFDGGGKDWLSLARLLLWFGWPAWPLALWTLWRWRQQIFSRPGQRHLLLPLWFTLAVHWRHHHHPAGRPGIAAGPAGPGCTGSLCPAYAAPQRGGA